MKQQYCIKVKRKGFNYYTDYMERYLEKVAVEYGYHLTKRKSQADKWCISFIGDPQLNGSKWIIFTSETWDNLTYEQVEELSRLIGACFKSESVLEAADDRLMELTRTMKAVYFGEKNLEKYPEIAQSYGFPYPWFFSREHGAFDEPVYFAGGETVFKKYRHDTFCESGKMYNVSALNVGGPSKGLAIDISFANIDGVRIEESRWTVSNDRKQYPFELIRTDANDRIIFHAELPDFDIHGGFNEYSAKLCGRAKMNAAERCAVHFLFTPCGGEAILSSMEIAVTPCEYQDNKVIFRIGG